MITALDALAKAPYILLTTFRKDGTPVPTPVWAVRQGDELRVWTSASAGKLKRLRRDGRALVSPCTMRGRPLGDPIEVTGRVLTGEQAQEVFAALLGKYGWQARLANLRQQITKLRGKPVPPAGALALTFPPIPSAAG